MSWQLLSLLIFLRWPLALGSTLMLLLYSKHNGMYCGIVQPWWKHMLRLFIMCTQHRFVYCNMRIKLNIIVNFVLVLYSVYRKILSFVTTTPTPKKELCIVCGTLSETKYLNIVWFLCYFFLRVENTLYCFHLLASF